MEVYERVYTQDFPMIDSEGTRFALERGKTYTVSRPEKGKVVVFSKYWVSVPATLFVDERRNP